MICICVYYYIHNNQDLCLCNVHIVLRTYMYANLYKYAWESWCRLAASFLKWSTPRWIGNAPPLEMRNGAYMERNQVRWNIGGENDPNRHQREAVIGTSHLRFSGLGGIWLCGNRGSHTGPVYLPGAIPEQRARSFEHEPRARGFRARSRDSDEAPHMMLPTETVQAPYRLRTGSVQAPFGSFTI